MCKLQLISLNYHSLNIHRSLVQHSKDEHQLPIDIQSSADKKNTRFIEGTSANQTSYHLNQSDQTISLDSTKLSQVKLLQYYIIQNLSQMQSMIDRIQQLKKTPNLYDQSIQEEKDYIYKLIFSQIPKRHYLEFQWAYSYTHYLDQQLQSMGQINNFHLIKKSYEPINVEQCYAKSALKNFIQKDIDYVMVNEYVWKFIYQMYGGGPEITNQPSRVFIKKLEQVDNQDEEFPIFPDEDFPQAKISVCPLVGIYNTKYFCYINAILQCLFSINQLNEYYISQATSQKMFTQAYSKVVNRVINSSDNYVISIKSFYELFQQQFSSCEMHDSQEFLLHFLGKLEEEFDKQKQKKHFESAKQAFQQYCESTNNIITDLFEGELTSVIKCTECQVTSQTKEPFWDLSLSIDGEKELYDCFDKFFQDEIIQDSWFCEHCGSKNKNLKRKIYMSKCPKILILHLKRFQLFPNKQKLKDGINFDLNLNIQKQIKNRSLNNHYTLNSVVVHSGCLDAGHYRSINKRNGKVKINIEIIIEQWYLFDDEDIRRIKEKDLLRMDQGYIFFYEIVL